jgi:hypothetical protein
MLIIEKCNPFITFIVLQLTRCTLQVVCLKSVIKQIFSIFAPTLNNNNSMESLNSNIL